MGGDEVGIGLVQAVAVPVVHQSVGRVEVVGADNRQLPLADRESAAFVDIVAVVEDEVEILDGEVAEGREVAVLEVLTAGDAESNRGTG